MKRFVLFLFAAIAAFSVVAMAGPQKVTVYNRLTKQTASYPLVTIRQIEEVSMDSLAKADLIQATTSNDTARLQYSPFYQGGPNGDTVVVRALVVVPWNVINFTADGYTMLLFDTVNAYPWGGLLVRVDDQVSADGDGFKNPVAGDIVEMTLVIREFPPYQGQFTLNSQTEPAPVPGFPITKIGHKAIPPPVHMNVSDFYHGQYQAGGTVNFSGGEPYENLIVEFTDVDYNGELFTGPGRSVFRLIDGSGNELTSYDASRWFTVRTDLNTNTGLPYRDPASTWSIPPVGSHIDTIRGYMGPASGNQNARGYRVSPLYPGDVVVGNIKPTMSTHRRNPVIVTPTDTARITAKVQVGTFPLSGTFAQGFVRLYYSVNFGAYTTVNMAKDSLTDTVYHAKVPPLPLGSIVSYYMKVQDTTGLNSYYASAHPSLGSDTSKGKFLYRVVAGSLSIFDLQYTPYISGYSPYIGARVAVSGTVTADTNHLGKTMYNPSGNFGTYTWYIQSGNQPWNGIWVQAPESLMHGIVNGDSILVRGTVGEGTNVNAIVTQLYNIDSVFVIGHNRPVPAPITKTTGTFGPSAFNGTPTAEPYEGMLVRFVNVHVSSLFPYFSDPTEYGIDDGSGEVRVRRDGTNNFTNIPSEDTALGKIMLNLGDKIDTLIGIMYYSANAWKIVPRANDDFRSSQYYAVNNRWNIVSVPQRVPSLLKTAVYPMVSQPTYTYDHGYIPKDTLAYGVGYWAKFSGAQNIRYNGIKKILDTVRVKAGWNMVGSITDSVPVGSIVPSDANLIKSPFYQYTTGYNSVTMIKGGRGYWMKAGLDGYFILNSGSFFSKQVEPEGRTLEALNSVTITDRNGVSQTLYFGPVKDGKIDLNRYEMPPLPPLGTFDARFATQRMVELYPNQLKSALNYSIKLTSPAYPLTVSWSITDKDPNRAFQIAGVGADKNTKAVQMFASGSAVIKNAKEDILVLTVNNSALPKQFALSQNYPNPFNPTTKFTVAVPQNAHIEVIVYDILGRKVKTLLDEEKAAGYFTLEWNGLSEANTSVSSGVYFVRMNSDRFTAVRKIMMMK